jgi:Lon-like protease
MQPCWRTVQWVVMALIAFHARASAADHVVEVPILSMIPANDRGAFLAMVLNWDKKPSPNPVELQWGNQRVRVMGTGLGALHAAFRYAVDRTPTIAHTGTITIYNASYVPTNSDGPSAGAAMAVGFLAVFRGDRIIRGVAVTGTLDPDGRIGPVGGIPDKVRAAKREGYRLVLIPAGQTRTPRWNLDELALDLNITIKEVETVDHAYELMTGLRLSVRSEDEGMKAEGSLPEPLLASHNVG